MGSARVGSKPAVTRLNRSVEPPSYSMRRPRFSESFFVTRQSSCRYQPKAGVEAVTDAGLWITMVLGKPSMNAAQLKPRSPAGVKVSSLRRVYELSKVNAPV